MPATVMSLPDGMNPKATDDVPINTPQPVGGALSLPPFGAYIGLL
jgi:hypothetical protein